jgi:metal-responsive CopG/Arc/MetJ family transcriptional regulator
MISAKLDSQLARAFKQYEQRSGLTRSKALRKLLRSALGIRDADGEAQEQVMDAIAKSNRAISERARTRGTR